MVGQLISCNRSDPPQGPSLRMLPRDPKKSERVQRCRFTGRQTAEMARPAGWEETRERGPL